MHVNIVRCSVCTIAPVFYLFPMSFLKLLALYSPLSFDPLSSVSSPSSPLLHFLPTSSLPPRLPPHFLVTFPLLFPSAIDVDFCCGRLAVFASRSACASVAIFSLKTLQFIDEMEIDHLSSASTSIVKLTEDWVIR